MMETRNNARVKDVPAAPAGGREAHGANRRLGALGVLAALVLVFSMTLGVVAAFADPIGGGGTSWGGGGGVVGDFYGHKVITVWADDRNRATATEKDAPQGYGMDSAEWFYANLKWIMDGAGLYPYTTADTGIYNTYYDFMDVCRRALDNSHNEALVDPDYKPSMGGTEKDASGNYTTKAYTELNTRLIAVGVYVQHWPGSGDYYQGGRSTWIQNQSLIRSFSNNGDYANNKGANPILYQHNSGTYGQPSDYVVPDGMDLSWGMEQMDWIVLDYGVTGYDDPCTRTGFDNMTWREYVWNVKWEGIKWHGANQVSFAAIAISNDDVWGYMTLEKNSTGNLTWVKGNRMYSLAGAEYMIYETREDAMANRNPVSFKDENDHEQTKLITKADGSSNLAKIKKGDYWVKEVKPAPGHYIDLEPHKVSVTTRNKEDNPAVAKSSDNPASHLEAAKVMKYVDGEHDKYLDKAQYTIKYYDQVVTSAAQARTLWNGNTQKATWVIETGKYRGTIPAGASKFYGDFSDAKGAGFACLEEQWLVDSLSDPLYKDLDGKTTIPLGTVIIQETKAPPGYHLTNGDGRPVDAQHPADLFVYNQTLPTNEAMVGPNGVVRVSKISPDYYVAGKLPDGRSAQLPQSIIDREPENTVLTADPPKRANVELFKVDQDRFDLMYYPIAGYEYGGPVPMNEAQGDVPNLSGAVFRIVNTTGDTMHSPIAYDTDVAKNADIITITTDANGYATTLPDKADVSSFASAHDFKSYADMIDDARGWMNSGSSTAAFYPSANTHPGYSLTKRSIINGWTMHWKAAKYGGALSPGTYRVYEVSAPDGYMVNPSWSGVVTIPDEIKGDGTDMFVIKTATN